MFSLMLCLCLSGTGEPKVTSDLQLIQIILEEAQRIKDLEAQKSGGCPFDPGTYWNVDCA